jgi:hypothetical protein
MIQIIGKLFFLLGALFFGLMVYLWFPRDQYDITVAVFMTLLSAVSFVGFGVGAIRYENYGNN